MPAPGIITGGDITTVFNGINDVGAFYTDTTEGSTNPEMRRGVFASTPGSTPKYATNRGQIKAEYEDTLARLFVDIPPGVRRDSFIRSVSKRARPLATVLTSGAGTGGAGSTGFIDFLLTQANESFQEKAQIVDTLTDNYVAFYSGQEPPVFGYSGVLLNTYQDDQRVWMLLLYREILRGSRLAHRNLSANLRYDSFVVSGYLETLNLSLSGENDNTASQFSFTMRVRSMQIITPDLVNPSLKGLDATGTTGPNDATTLTLDGLATANSTFNPRNACVTSNFRAAAARVDNDAKTVRGLRAAGLSDAAIQRTMALSAAATNNDVDARSIVVDPQAQATDRLVAASVGTDTKTSNAANIAADGQGGSSNVRGPERPAVVTVTPPVYAPTPAQSGLIADNTRAAQSVSNAAQGYQSLKAKLKAIRKKRTRGRYTQQTYIAGSDGQPVAVTIAT